VSKYSLQNEVPTAIILNDVNTTLETRALARLAGHKFLLDEIQTFRNKYPDWKLCITELLSDLGTKYRGKKKPNEKKMVKSKMEAKSKILKKDGKRTTDVEEFENVRSMSVDADSLVNSEDDTGIVGYDLNESDVTLEETQVKKTLPINNNTSNEDQNEELNHVIPGETISKEKNINLSKCDKSVKLSKVDIKSLGTQIPNLVKIQLPEKKFNSTNESADDIDVGIIIEQQPLKRKAEYSSVSSIIDNKKKRNMVDEIQPVCETVDSFFMTVDDKDYMSVYKPPPAAPVTENNVEYSKLDYQKPTKEIFIKGKKVTLGKQKSSMCNRRERRQQQVEEPIDTVLHPSWEAKRKQKLLAKFEGKKITFDDQD